MFPVNNETHAGIFKFLEFEERFRNGLEKTVDLTVDRAVHSNFSIVVWKQSEFGSSFSHKSK